MNMKFWKRWITVLLLLLPVTQLSAAVCPARVLGINLVPLPSGWYNGKVEAVFPTAAQITYYKGVGMNAIRLPLAWEDLQPQLNGELDARFIGHTVEFLDLAQAQGMKVMIDLHNYARYRGQLIGTEAVPAAAFEDLWTRVAGELGKHPAIFSYGLMNEPHNTNNTWHTVAQAGVDGIRAADKTRPIYVDGDGWSGTQNWPVDNPQPFVSDPANKIVYEAHVYFDDDFSGRYKTPVGSTDMAVRAEQRLQPFLTWLTSHHQRGAIGETGVPMDDPRWLPALSKFLDMTDAACLDWFMWAGVGWRENYELSLEPINGQDRPQIKLLRSRL